MKKRAQDEQKEMQKEFMTEEEDCVTEAADSDEMMQETLEDEEEEYEDEEEEEDDEDQEYLTPQELKRIRRRNRRIRNVILAYSVAFLVIFGLVAGVFVGGQKLLKHLKQEKKAEQAMAEQIDDMIADAEEEIVISGPEEPVEEVVVSPLDEVVLARIAEMPIEDKIAALFMVTPDKLTGVDGVTKAGETTQNMLDKYKVGGMVYTAANLKDENQIKELLANTAKIDQTLFLAIKESGGKNSPVASKTKADATPDGATIGATGDVNQAKDAGAKVGAYLTEYGFNMNLAPSADISVVENNILGIDGFGSDSAQVGGMAAAYIQGLQEQNVYACVTTFPGLGSVVESTAAGMANSERSLEELKANEFAAYKMAMDAGAQFLMVGTISASGITGDNTPCCLSKTAIDLVRNELGFEGVVMTGPLNEASITDYHTSKDAAVMAIRAGADMIYMPENFTEAYEGLLAEVKDAGGSIDEARIDESLLRIYRVKYKDRIDKMNTN